MSTGRLLVVDDSPTVRKLVELSFAGSGWQAEYAMSGAQALDSILRAPPDVMLLDFVLPDMRGVDVCQTMIKHAALRALPFVVMSGKGSSVAGMFRPFEGFHGCIGKPSTSEQIREAVESAFAARSSTSSESLSREAREAAAKAIYPVLRDVLAQIPRFMSELGEASPAPFFARKLLTPEIVGRLLTTLGPAARAVRSSLAPAPTLEDASLQGTLRGWPVAGLITFLEASARSGELTLELDGQTTIAYLRAGEVVMVTTREPTYYLRGSMPSAARLTGVPREALRAAEDEQRASATPLFVTLAASGDFPARELTEVLRALGRKLLLNAVEASSVRFAFRDLASLPSYVQAHGRHVSFQRNTLAHGLAAGRTPESLSAEQLSLLRLRENGPRSLPSEAQVFARAHGFSSRVAAFELTAAERRVLALVDGVSSARELAARAAVPLEEMRATLGCMTEIDLLRSLSAAPHMGKPRTLMILENDVEDFQAPLASLLERRADPVRLLDLSREVDQLGAVNRERPEAVMLSTSNGSSRELARRLRACEELAGIQLVALVEPAMSDEIQDLLSDGFDTALVKPVAYADVERLLD